MTDRAAFELTPFRPSLRAGIIELWNRSFAHMRHFQPLTRERFAAQIERRGTDEFRPEHFVVALRGESVIGFAHGGEWKKDFLAAWQPSRSGGTRILRAGYLGMILVAEAERRRGIGKALLAALKTEIFRPAERELPFFADGRMFNPFYGNSLAPRPPLWGTTEGIAVPAEDAATRAALCALAFAEVAPACTMFLDFENHTGRSSPETHASARAFDAELVEESDFRPILGTGDGSSFAEPNRSRTWALVESGRISAYLIAYPLAPEGDDRPASWGIYALEVLAELRGKGRGRALLLSVLESLAASGARTVESLMLPSEAPAAMPLYTSAGFRKAAEWVVFE